MDFLLDDDSISFNPDAPGHQDHDFHVEGARDNCLMKL
jgi:hypothetical protein